MALRDQPYIPLYVQDYLTDEKLNNCSASSQGVYIKMMCIFHKSDEYGGILLKQKDKQGENICYDFALKFARLLPFTFEEIYKAINELLDEKVLTIENDFLFQKRMVRDNKVSIERSMSGKKGGKKTQLNIKKFAKAKVKANSEYEYVNNTYSSLLKKVLEKNSIILPEGFETLILEWLKYKSEKGQSYKETGLKTLVKTFLKDSELSLESGRAMLDYSMSKNYTGLFKQKQYNGNNNKPDQRSEKRINDMWKDQKV